MQKFGALQMGASNWSLPDSNRTLPLNNDSPLQTLTYNFLSNLPGIGLETPYVNASPVSWNDYWFETLFSSVCNGVSSA